MPGAEPGPAHSSAAAATRGTVQMLLGRAVFVVCGYAITILLARGLGPAAYGTYGLIMSFLVWVESATGVGIPRATMTLMPREQDPSAVAALARTLLVLVSLCAFAACWLLAPRVASAFAIDDGAHLIRLAILDIPLNGLLLAYYGTLQAERRFSAVAIGVAVYSLTKLIGICFLIVIGLSIAAALVVNVLATVGALVFLVGRELPRFTLPRRAPVIAIARIALPWSMLGVCFEFLFSAHLWILKYVSSGDDAVIGQYVAALSIARLPTIAVTIIGGVMLTSISWSLADSDDRTTTRHLEDAFRFVSTFIIAPCALVVIHAPELMTLIYSEPYLAGGTYLEILLAAFCMFAFIGIPLHALMAIGEYKRAATILLGLLAGGVLLSVVLSGRLGAVGAAVSLLVTMLAGACFALVVSRKSFAFSLRVASLARVVAIIVVVAVIGALLRTAGVWLLLELSGLLALYLLALWVSGELKRHHLMPLSFSKPK